MQCDICHRTASSKLPFNCTTCARDTLYQPRLEHARILLEKEAIEKQVEQNTSSGSKPARSSPSSSTKWQEANSAWLVQRASADQIVCEEQTQAVHSHLRTLREEIQKMKEDIAARKARLSRRHSDLTSAKQELTESKATAQETLEKGIRRTTHRWDILHTKTAESRLFLCKEAAQLYGLQQHKRKRGSKGRDVYTLGGTPIVDLRDLNNASPVEITVSTTHLAHLVHLASHYLSLKLPAEITLPHRDYPSATIFSPASSYTTTRDIPFPGSSPSHSPEASRHNTTANDKSDSRPLPRPRILHLDKPLSVLAKDDQLAYANFVEGITFLAWDIAWLCRTQGLPVGQNSWEDICAIGRNLYHLLLAPPSPSPPPLPTPTQPPTTKLPFNGLLSPQKGLLAAQKTPIPSRNPSAKTTTTTTTITSPLAPERETPPPPLPPPGHFSHSTTYAFLSTATGTEYMRSWRLASVAKAVERVKAMLLAERTGAEWEILEGEEWAGADDDEAGDGGRRQQRGDEVNSSEQPAPQLGMGATGVFVKPAVALRGGARDRRVDSGTESGREKARDRDRDGANGWMKVKSRSGEPDGGGVTSK